MSHKLISHSPDLLKLIAEGFEVSIHDGTVLLVSGIPYVTPRGEVAYGTLVSKLELAGDRTSTPIKDHVAYFIGEHPHYAHGGIITGIQHSQVSGQPFAGIEVDYMFSGKLPDRLYVDYHEKITNYVGIIESEAQVIDPNVRARTHKPIESSEPDIPFQYFDTNATRAEISALSAVFKSHRIAIVGLGGTGSYILDQVSKTPVAEIHLYDGDTFLSHNAFRSPGAASMDELRAQTTKVAYFKSEYSKMHKYVFDHPYFLDESNVGELASMDFVFICIDKAEPKKTIIPYLVNHKIPFIDTGLGVELIDGKLRGGVRSTTFTDGDPAYLKKWISFADNPNDEYAQNIQIAELNSLNASMAVIKWKKLIGFYHDLEKELNGSYDIDVNTIINDADRT